MRRPRVWCTKAGTKPSDLTSRRPGSDSPAIQLGELVEYTLSVDEVQLGDVLDLPVDEVQLTIATMVTCDAVGPEVRGVDVDLDRPPDFGHGQIDSHATTIRQLQLIMLCNHRHASGKEPVQDGEFRVGLHCRPLAALHQRAGEQDGARPGGVTQAAGSSAEVLQRAVPLVHDLLEDRGERARSQISGQVEEQPRP